MIIDESEWISEENRRWIIREIERINGDKEYIRDERENEYRYK